MQVYWRDENDVASLCMHHILHLRKIIQRRVKYRRYGEIQYTLDGRQCDFHFEYFSHTFDIFQELRLNGKSTKVKFDIRDKSILIIISLSVTVYY